MLENANKEDGFPITTFNTPPETACPKALARWKVLPHLKLYLKDATL